MINAGRGKGVLGIRYGKVEDLSPWPEKYCQFMEILAPVSLNSAEVTSSAPCERESIQNFEVPQAAFEQLDGSKSEPMARLAENSLLDDFQLVRRSGDFFDAYYPGPVVESSEAEGVTRVCIVTSRSLGSLVNPTIADGSTDAKTFHAPVSTAMRMTSCACAGYSSNRFAASARQSVEQELRSCRQLC